MLKHSLICFALVPVLAGCSTGQSGGTSALPSFISSPSPRIPFVAALGAGAYYLYKDNWTLEEIQTGDDKFRITLKKNMLRQDGDSEGDMLFKRRAGEIVTELGYDGYRIMEYSEGIESAALGPQRVAHGVIQCYKGAATAK
ncbi:hypothetical protein SCD_n02049 [Sulfuricella denitrificans skB26]|uniref:Lipoprotein n=1 Tax=Sulfuricella denitrificans (strain DSM 22764 / NBRC 105220 / skB26) TaxID=1163617 RepID=S6AAH3_SULDS|nr:hypothetical protein [Sulfuricella denitrificans]BAN35860.1 hypothetical protein SCD_n02049 [Sulfuricella denitrificans skB26]